MATRGEKVNALLGGVRILDLSRVMSGPYCTAMLADLGAEVVKIEMPGRGDEARGFGPFKDGESAYFLLLNRGKRSVTIDMKSAEGAGLVKGLIRRSDVVVENFRPGVMDRLGLGYETARSLNAKLIYASISGFGQESPLAKLPAFDHVIQAMSGLMSITGEREGPPMAVGESLADVTTGVFAAWGIVAALFNRERTGEGRYLDITMLDSVASMLLTAWSSRLYLGRTPQRAGNRHPVTYPVDLFATRTDGIVMVVFSDELFRSLAVRMGKPELATDPRFVDNGGRHGHEVELRALIAAWTATMTAEEALDALREVGVPCAPVWSLEDLVSSDHAKVRELIAEGHHLRLGAVPLVPQPVAFSGTIRGSRQSTPTLGEDTDAVLEEILELGSDVRAGLRARGVI